MIISLHKNLRNNFRRLTCFSGLLLAIFFGFFPNNNLQAQVATGYQFSQDLSGPYVPISGGTVIIASGGTAGTQIVNLASIPATPLGFNFVYDNNTYSSIFISDNGFITFGTAPSLIQYQPISSGSYAGAISGMTYGGGLVSAESSASYQPYGATPAEVSYIIPLAPVGNRVCTVQYKNMIRKPAFGAPVLGLLNFQIKLYEGSNKIEIIYDAIPTTPALTTLGTGQQVGLRGPDATFATNVNNRMTAWSSSSIGTANNSSMVISSGSIPVSGTRFIWKPCYQATALTASQIPNSVVTWTAPVMGDGTTLTYDYEIRTSGAFGSGATGLITSGNTATTTFTASGLTPGVTYTFYVRTSPNCGGTPVSVTITPVCNPQAIPYSQNFESTIVPALPSCHSTVNYAGTPFTTAYTNPAAIPSVLNAAGQFTGNYATATADTDSWYFTEAITVPAGNYKLTYKYGGDRSQNFFVQKMRVFIGTSPAAASGANNMTGGVLLDTHPNIKASPNLGDITFNVPTGGTYYLGFQAYNGSGNGPLYLDDILLEPATCLPVSNIVAQNITYSSADLSWTSSPTVDDGYLIFVSSTGQVPANNDYTGTYFSSAPSLALNGLSGSTTYCVWVRTVCDGGLTYGAWTKLTTPASGCFATPAAPPAWCNTPVSTNGTTYITNFTTTGGVLNISNNSGNTYSSGSGYQNYTSQIVSQSIGTTVNFSADVIVSGGVGFAIWIDWDADGAFNNTNERVFVTPGPGYVSVSPITGSFTVPSTVPAFGLGNYRMRVMTDWNAPTPTQSCNYVSGRGEIEDYTFKLVTTPPALTLSSTGSTQCGNVITGLVTLTTPIGNFGTNSNYVMTPSTGVTGNATSGYTFSSLVSQVYILTGKQTVSPFSVNTVSYTYTAYSTPTPITISPATMAVCANGPAKLLTASGGLVSGVEILKEDFEGATIPTGWSSAYTYLVAGNPSAAVSASAWTLRPNNYNPGGTSGISALRSNDSSQFYLSNSDAQGSNNYTSASLTSKIFSLSGYASATLNFYHYYKVWSNGSAKVEISNDGTTWTLIDTWGNTGNGGVTVGAATNFATQTPGNYSLNAFVGQTTLRVRFTYEATWGYVWALDNFKVTGSTANSTTWSPITELYLDLGNGVVGPAYTGQITNTVYAFPTIARTYTATAVTPAPLCYSSKSINVTITPIVKGTVSGDQFTCTGLQSSLSTMYVTGLAVGNTVLKWEYSDSPTFIPATPCPISNSTSLATFKMGTFPLTQDRYIRAVIINGSCTINSDPIKITFSKTTTNDGITWSNGLPVSTKALVFDGPGTYTIAGNINACSVTVLNGAVVTISGVLTVENGLNTTAGTLKFDDNSSLLQTSTAANTTPISYLRKSTLMRAFDFTHWSSPVSGQLLRPFSPFTLLDKYFIWDTSLANPYWASVPFPTTTAMTVGRGYIIRSQLAAGDPGTTTHIDPFVGPPNNGNLSTSIQISGASGVNNWNLIGNPYPSGLNADLFLSANSTKVNGTIYIWTHNTPLTNNTYNNSNDFASYNMSGGIGTASTTPGVSQNKVPTGIIASGQAFFVSVLPAVQVGGALTTSSVNFTNAMRVGAGNNVFFRSNDQNYVAQSTTTALEKNRIWLDMINVQGAFSEMLYGNIETATNGLDQMFDSKLTNFSTTVSFYSMLGNDRLSIKGNALPYSITDTNDLGYKATVAGNFQIKLANFDGLFVSENIYLEDKLLNVIHDLKQSDYDFTTQVGTFNERFVLRFTNSALANTKTIFTENTVFVYKSNSDIHIKTPNIEMKSIAVYDINGRTIYNNDNVSGSEFVINNLNAAQQVLIVKVTATDGKIVNKKIVF